MTTSTADTPASTADADRPAGPATDGGGIRVANVSHAYKSVQALRDFTLDMEAGGSLAIVGPDGVGKSTLLGLIAGATRIQSGTVSVLGADLARRAERNRVQPRIAFMPQGLGRNLYANLSVVENITFFARLFGQTGAAARARVEPLLAATGLAPFADRLMRRLSGGMKQKLGLCCALVHDPDLLILDEPTTGVDPLSRRQFWELIDGIRAARPGLGLVVATSDMDEAIRFPRVVMMDEGRILADGTPAELLARTGCDSLERAFISLLPAEKRGPDRSDAAIAPIPADAPVAIESRGLTRRFGDFVAVDNVSFSIRRGEIFGFLGSNGCGKSTTMKMLTGLLPATSGEAFLFGSPLDAGDIETRRRVGYMSQSFSLYGELTVRQNLDLHAGLFDIRGEAAEARIKLLVENFGLGEDLDALADSLPLGVRQRLSLAVAILHEPEILILDEPTSGVDPVARDRFWDDLQLLSRRDGVTIFISTHFMSEAARCDRISFMHAGKVIATGTPAELQEAQHAPSLEEAFIAYMELGGRSAAASPPPAAATEAPPPANPSLLRIAAYAGREAVELTRDRVRLAFALGGTVILMLIFGFGITLDVDNLRFAVLDRDDTPESRALIDEFAHSTYFVVQPALTNPADLERRLVDNDIAFAIEIPPSFGADLRSGRSTEISAAIDGAMPFRAETIKSYVQAVYQRFLMDAAETAGNTVTQAATVEMRYRYNQSFRSVEAMVPATIALLLIFIPAILTALAVVTEKELGSITNLYVTPVTKLEFLLGKQLPYAALAFLNFLMLTVMAMTVFGVPLKGSFLGLALCAVLYVLATTAIGLVSSALTRTQVAALFGTAIGTMVPATQFSGLMQPVATLEGSARIIGTLFPTTYFLRASVGAFTKGLDFAALMPFALALTAFWPALLAIAFVLLHKQGR